LATIKFRKTYLSIVILACTIFLIQSPITSISRVSACGTTTAPLDVEVDVGSIHFRGEMAEFYILVSYLGKPFNAEISAMLYYNGTLLADLTASAQNVTTGLYMIQYSIPMEASAGTYALVVNASHCTFKGTALKSFLLSQTLTNWNAWIIDIQGKMAIIETDIGTIKVSLEAINASLVSIDGRIATIETDLGTIKTDISNIDLRLTSIEGNIVTINSTLGEIHGTIVSIQEDIATIKTDIGSIRTDISSINATLHSINGTLVTIQTNIGEIQVTLTQINAKLTALNETVVTIQTDIGIIKASIEDIKANITSIQGNIANINTTLGSIQGTLVSIQADIATIKTDLGNITLQLPPTQTTTLGIPIAAILAGIAAGGSTISATMLLRRRKNK
jgi:peptidoglycan hydrolase CwlO-like protein